MGEKTSLGFISWKQGCANINLSSSHSGLNRRDEQDCVVHNIRILSVLETALHNTKKSIYLHLENHIKVETTGPLWNKDL